ncbi:hypothetical protein FSP39_000039 [Pinctada imbricata]|uniref:Major facilitator superfamily (MFS) profile domain-containing protein n=1 Tax=Pinctada imbricata TaxID=66713 RepID=A0AA88Y2I4_PINIB|nr:hypothetical protein FSP39_000039 [Pinctada imbricata]
MIDQNLDVDDIWRVLRPWGRYQIGQLVFMWLAMIPCVIHLMASVFIGYRPGYRCKTDHLNYGNMSVIQAQQCSIKVYPNASDLSDFETKTCDSGYNYDDHVDISFVTEWDLVCTGAEMAELSQALVLLGQGFGGFIFTSISDKFGRKPVHVTSHVLLFLLTASVTVIPSYTGFAIVRFLIGAMVEGLLLTSVVQYVETLPVEWRFCAEVIGLASWTTGIIIVTPFGYLMRGLSWRYLQLALSLISTYSLIEYWLFDESLRWLMANGKLKEAERVLRKAAKRNKMEFDEVIKQVKERMAAKVSNENELTSVVFDPEKKEATVYMTSGNDSDTKVELIKKIENVDQYQVKSYSMWTIITTPRILFNSVIIWIVWVTNSLTYYGLTLISASLVGDRFLNYFFIGAIEYLSALMEFLLLNRIGRRRTVILFLAIAGVCLLTATMISVFTGLGGLATFFVILGKWGITGSFSSIFLYTSEIYPTNMRNAGYGCASVAARVGSVLSPFAATLGNYVKWGPGVVFTSLCLLSSILVLFLPETTGKQLPTTIEELKTWYKENKGLKFGANKKKGITNEEI